MSQRRAMFELNVALAACEEHAKRCRECFHPIVDAEGNPGYLGEACKVGYPLLKRYMDAEETLLRS